MSIEEIMCPPTCQTIEDLIREVREAGIDSLNNAWLLEQLESISANQPKAS